MAEEKKVVDPALAGFYEAMEKTNREKITKRDPDRDPDAGRDWGRGFKPADDGWV